MRKISTTIFILASLLLSAAPAQSTGAAMTDNTKHQTAYLAGGCFWGMEELVRRIPGVLETEVGYTGGNTPDARYE